MSKIPTAKQYGTGNKKLDKAVLNLVDQLKILNDTCGTPMVPHKPAGKRDHTLLKGRMHQIRPHPPPGPIPPYAESVPPANATPVAETPRPPPGDFPEDLKGRKEYYEQLEKAKNDTVEISKIPHPPTESEEEEENQTFNPDAKIFEPQLDPDAKTFEPQLNPDAKTFEPKDGTTTGGRIKRRRKSMRKGRKSKKQRKSGRRKGRRTKGKKGRKSRRTRRRRR